MPRNLGTPNPATFLYCEGHAKGYANQVFRSQPQLTLIEPERVEPPSFQVLSGVRQSGFGFLRTRLVSWRLRHSRVPDHDPKRTVVPQHSPSFIEHLIEREDIVIDALLQSYLAFHLVITLAKIWRQKRPRGRF